MSPTPESHPGAGAWPGDPARGPLVGRDAELSLLRGMVDPIPVASRVLVVLGDAGTGKSVLLADMAQRARSAGVRVLAVTGRESAMFRKAATELRFVPARSHSAYGSSPRVFFRSAP